MCCFIRSLFENVDITPVNVMSVMHIDYLPLPALLHCRWVVCERQLFSWLRRIIWTWISICILFFCLPVASDFPRTSPFFSHRVSLFFYCGFCIFCLSCFLLVIIEIFLFSVFIHAKQGRKRLSRHLYQNRPMIILSPALHMFTCTQLFLQCSAAADLWRLRVRVSVSICVQMTWLCLSAYVCSCLARYVLTRCKWWFHRIWSF